MTALVGQTGQIGLLDRERTWPLEARMAMFVLEAEGGHPEVTRQRNLPRVACRIEATVVIHSEDKSVVSEDRSKLVDTIVYVRDFNPGHVGYISSRELPVGDHVLVDLPAGGNGKVRTRCRIGRSRSFMAGWYEGVIHLSDEQFNHSLAA